MQRVGFRVPEDVLLELRSLVCGSQVRLRVDWLEHGTRGGFQNGSPLSGAHIIRRTLVAYGNPYALRTRVSSKNFRACW